MFCFGASAYYILGSRRLTNLMGGWEDGWEGEGRGGREELLNLTGSLKHR